MAETIVCGVTKWYFKRMSLMTLMFVGFGAYFFYDGAIGYPRKNKIYDAHEDFQAMLKERVEFLETQTEAEWDAYAKSQGYPTETDWAKYAAQNKWSQKPPEKRYDSSDLKGQFFFGTLCSVIGLGILGTMLLNRGRTLRADDEGFSTPKGERVPFDKAYKIDRRKWDHKALAYVYYRDEGGKENRAVLDDLKFDGAGKILDRLLANFQGEIIDRVAEISEEESGSTNTEVAPSEERSS